MEEVPRAYPSCTLLYDYFNRSGSKGAFSFPGATWDRFRCTVEPLPGHIGCRMWRFMNPMWPPIHGGFVWFLPTMEAKLTIDLGPAS